MPVPVSPSASVPQTDRAIEEIVDRASRAPLELDTAPSLRQRVSRALSVPMLAGTAVFAIAVIIAIVVTALQARPAAQAASELAPSSAAADGAAAAGSAEDRSSAAGGGSPSGAGEKAEVSAMAGAGSPARVTVHVVGEVAKPGVVEVAHGARLAEAIEAAGGATPAAVLESVNLARRIIDGEQVLVPNAEQAAAMPPVTGAAAAGEAAGDGATGTGGADGASGSAGTAGSAAGGGASALVNLNTADATALETLPRVGPALAQRIIEWRSTHGGFASVDQLLEVSGIGQKTLDGFRDQVTV